MNMRSLEREFFIYHPFITWIDRNAQVSLNNMKREAVTFDTFHLNEIQFYFPRLVWYCGAAIFFVLSPSFVGSLLAWNTQYLEVGLSIRKGVS